MTKAVLQRALDDELTGHLGYDKRDPAGRGSGNSRSGARPKRLLTEIGSIGLDVPRGCNGTYRPDSSSRSPVIGEKNMLRFLIDSAWRDEVVQERRVGQHPVSNATAGDQVVHSRRAGDVAGTVGDRDRCRAS